MATAADRPPGDLTPTRTGTASTPTEVTARLHVDPVVGLANETAAQLLAQNGPNALPAEKSVPAGGGSSSSTELHADHPGRRGDRFAGDQGVEHRGAAAGDHRGQRRRRAASGGQGRERDERAQGDGQGHRPSPPRWLRGARSPPRRWSSATSSCWPPETRSPRTGASSRRARCRSTRPRSPARACPRPKGTATPSGTDLSPGEQTDMAFMHTPVTHGSGVMIVTATGSRHRGRAGSPGCSRPRPSEQTPLTGSSTC